MILRTFRNSWSILSMEEIEVEQKLKSILDYQRFSPNRRLSAIIEDVATTEEISAQSDTIRDLSDGIQGEVNAI